MEFPFPYPEDILDQCMIGVPSKMESPIDWLIDDMDTCYCRRHSPKSRSFAL